MSIIRSRGVGTASVSTCALSVLLLGATAAWAQNAPKESDNLLDQARRSQAVAVQRVESQVRSALIEAEKLSNRDSAGAASLLRDALKLLDADAVLKDSRRDTLTRVVNDRIRVIEQTQNQAASDDADKLAAKAVSSARRADEDVQAKDQAIITNHLTTIRDLRAAGKFDEATKLANELAMRYPGTPVAQANRRTASVAEQIATARQVRTDRDRRIAVAATDVQRSSAPALGDVEFPKDWAEKTKTRAKSQNLLTAKEKAIVSTLASPITVQFKNSRFEDVIDYLQTISRQPILIDKHALDEAGVNYDTPVTVNMKGVAMRTLLRRILSDFGMTYVVKDETIQVVSATKAKEMMITRSYYMGDVIAGLGNAGLIFGPAGDQLQTQQNAARIMETIQDTVDSTSWQKNGGQGTIMFHAATLSIIIRQSAEVHGMLGSSLLP